MEPFPVKLHAVLELADVQGGQYSRAIKWLPHGCAFEIVDEEEFMESIVPDFFSNQSQFRSFIRQLHLWGFQRVPRGTDRGAWFHEHFLRGFPGEMKQMVRTKIKSRSKKGQQVKGRGRPQVQHRQEESKTKPDQLEAKSTPGFYMAPSLPSASLSSAGELSWGFVNSRRVSMESMESRIPGSAPAGELRPTNMVNAHFPEVDDASNRCISSSPPHNSANSSVPEGLPATIFLDRVLENCGIDFEPLPLREAPNSLFGALCQEAALSVCYPADAQVNAGACANVGLLHIDHSKVNVGACANVGPLPFDHDVPIDDFSNYIDRFIQVL